MVWHGSGGSFRTLAEGVHRTVGVEREFRARRLCGDKSTHKVDATCGISVSYAMDKKWTWCCCKCELSALWSGQAGLMISSSS